MNLEIGLLLLQDGITSAAVYALLATALILVFSVTRAIFILQGELVTFGALSMAAFEAGRVPGTLYLLLAMGAAVLLIEMARHLRGERVALRSTVLWAVVIPAVAAGLCHLLPPTGQVGRLLLVALIVVPMGPLLYRIVYRPMADASILTLLIASMALHVVLVGLGLYFFGPEGARTAPLSDARLDLGGIVVPAQALVVIAASLILATALFAAFRYSLAGKALRAAAMNRRGARIVGIPVQLSGEIAMAIAALIGVLSAVLIAPITTLYYDSGFLIGLKGFVAAITGGLGSYVLAGVGALVVGVTESFASFWSSAFKEVLVFSLVLPVMWWRSMAVRHVEDEK